MRRDRGLQGCAPVRAYFAASDNYPLASAGVIAHTVSVVFEDFADYHGAGDEWPKIDFPNMERTVRMVERPCS